MLDPQRLQAAQALRRARVKLPDRFAERPADEQARVLDEAVAELQTRTNDARARKVLELYGLMPKPVECSPQWVAAKIANMPRQPFSITSLVAVTSISPNESRRGIQQVCIESWQRLGLTVIAVQHAHEIPFLASHFPGVEFVEAKRRHGSKPNVLINDLADVLIDRDTAGILINSDIEIRADQTEFLRWWTPTPRVHVVGVRQNYDDNGSEPEPSGFDVFLLTPEMARSLPEFEFAIGLPFWDYWLPHHFRDQGYRVEIKDAPIFWHRRHELNWSQSDWRNNCDLFQKATGINRSIVANYRASLGRVDGANTAAIFIKTCPKDHAWVPYCLRSIQRFAKGFNEIVIVDDESGREEIEGWGLGAESVYYVPDPPDDHGYIQQQIVKLQADSYTDCEFILYLDSDTIFIRECTPASFFRDGKPLWLKGRYGKVGGAIKWQHPTESALGHPVAWEYMRRGPFMVRRDTLSSLRDAYPDMLSKMAEMRGLDAFSEFNVLGAFAEKNQPELYTFANWEGEPWELYTRHHWSWGGITNDISGSIELALA